MDKAPPAPRRLTDIEIGEVEAGGVDALQLPGGEEFYAALCAQARSANRFRAGAKRIAGIVTPHADRETATRIQPTPIDHEAPYRKFASLGLGPAWDTIDVEAVIAEAPSRPWEFDIDSLGDGGVWTGKICTPDGTIHADSNPALILSLMRYVEAASRYWERDRNRLRKLEAELADAGEAAKPAEEPGYRKALADFRESCRKFKEERDPAWDTIDVEAVIADFRESCRKFKEERDPSNDFPPSPRKG